MSEHSMMPQPTPDVKPDPARSRHATLARAAIGAAALFGGLGFGMVTGRLLPETGAQQSVALAAQPVVAPQRTVMPAEPVPSGFVPQVAAVAASRNLANTPRDIAELRGLEQSIRQVARDAVPTTVGLVVTGQGGAGQGSGVVISDDGYILTAAHVSGPPGRICEVIFSDGTRVRGRTLGRNRAADAGLVKIVDEDLAKVSPLKVAPVGASGGLPVGTWTVATGHPGGYQADRPPVVRVGRLNLNDDYLRTDNTLVGGDSGGPLFDLDGRVIGIHSRIGQGLDINIHVPVDQFVDEWDRLAAGEDYGNQPGRLALNRGGRVVIGIRFNRPEQAEQGEPAAPDGSGVLIDQLVPGGPADVAGMRAGDRIVEVAGRPVNAWQDLVLRLSGLEPDQPVEIVAEREGERATFRVVPVDRSQLWGGAAPLPDVPDTSNRPVMGVELQRTDDEDRPRGVRLGAVAPGGPAEAAGLRAGDRIIEMNEARIRTLQDWQQAFAGLAPGDQIRTAVRRDGETLRFTVTLARAGDIYPDGQP